MSSHVNAQGLSWKAYVIFSILLYLLSSKSVFAAPGPTVDVPPPPPPPAAAVEVTPTPLQASPASPSVTPDKSTTTTVIPTDGKSQTTIIINNNLGKTAEEPKPAPAPAAPVAPPAPPAPPVSDPPILEKSTVVIPPLSQNKPRDRRFRSSISLGVIGNIGDNAWSSSSYFDDDAYDYPLGSNLRGAITISFGVNLTSFLAIDAWGGVSGGSHRKEKGYVGTDIVLTPFRLASEDHNWLEIGGLVGVSTIRFKKSDVGPLHVGGRVNVNFTKSFGLISTLRVGGSYAMWDAGVITHF